MKKNTKSLSTLFYFKKYKTSVWLFVVVNILVSACTVAVTLLCANAIQELTLAHYSKTIVYLLSSFGVEVVRRILWTSSDMLYAVTSANIVSDLNWDLAKQSFKLNSSTYTSHSTGAFLNRIINDPNTIVENCGDIVYMLTNILSCLVILIYIATLNWIIGLIVVSVIIFAGLWERMRNKILRKNRKITNKASEKINSLTTEIIHSEKDIKSINLDEKLSEVAKKNYDEFKKKSIKREVTNMALYNTRNFIVEIASYVLLITGALLIDKSLITLATFMILYSYSDRLYEFAWDIGNLWSKFTEIKVANDRMFSLFDENEFITEKFGNITLSDVKGEIEFKNVNYSFKEYSEGDESNGKNSPRKVLSTNQVFNNLCFKIQPNTTVAFVGQSGSGKSTILNLMSKMYEVDSGEVLIDNTNINNLTKDSLRTTISLVNQFPYIFDMTIKENMLLAKKDATDNEIMEALENSALLDFVNTLPKGINTRVGESGIKLSGGQKQRLAIARALLKNSSIIIFDESTSSLDNFAQESIKKSLNNLKGKKTVVIVAHRLSTIKNADKIYFLDKGQIIDEGTFEELFNRNEKFKTMFLAENI